MNSLRVAWELVKGAAIIAFLFVTTIGATALVWINPEMMESAGLGLGLWYILALFVGVDRVDKLRKVLGL